MKDPPIRLATAEEAEACDVIVCMPADWPAPFTDNVTDHCINCGRRVQLRPTAPKNPVRMCMPCALDQAEELP